LSAIPRRTIANARAIAEALFSTDAGAPASDRLEFLERDLADFLAHVGLRARLLFRACVAAVVWIAPVLHGRLTPFARLSLADRVSALARMERSLFAMPFFGAKALLSIVYFEHADAAAEIGWDQRPKKLA
jgi:hypothetical protein